MGDEFRFVFVPRPRGRELARFFRAVRDATAELGIPDDFTGGAMELCQVSAHMEASGIADAEEYIDRVAEAAKAYVKRARELRFPIHELDRR